MKKTRFSETKIVSILNSLLKKSEVHQKIYKTYKQVSILDVFIFNRR